MGNTSRLNMQAFITLALVAAASAAPQYAPVVHAVAAPDLAEPSPYTYTYAVADDYSKANFQQSESNDGTGVVSGSYSVNLPDGRIQTVTYNANDITGNIAEVTYSGEPVYPPPLLVATLLLILSTLPLSMPSTMDLPMVLLLTEALSTMDKHLR